MKHPNLFSRSTESVNSSHEANDAWNHLNDALAEPDASHETAETTNHRKQSDKIIIGMLYDNPRVLGEDKITSTVDEQEQFYQKLLNGEITTADKSNFLQNIAAPMNRPKNLGNVYAQLNNEYERHILASVSGAQNTQDLSPVNLLDAQESYPTPYEFQDAERHIMSNVSQYLSGQELKNYFNSMQDFKRKFFGKRLEYYNVFAELDAEAQAYDAQQKARNEVLSCYHNQPTDEPAMPIIEMPRTDSIPRTDSDQTIIGDDFEIKSNQNQQSAENDDATQKLRTNEKKLIRLLVGKDRQLGGENTTVEHSDYSVVYYDIGTGKINNQTMSEILQTLATPFLRKGANPANTLNAIGQSKQERGILALMSGRGFENRDQIGTDDLKTALENYPTPFEYESFAHRLIDTVRANNPPETVRNYENAIDNFSKTFYGDRHDYYDAYQVIKADATTFNKQRQARTEEAAKKEREFFNSYPSHPNSQNQESHTPPDFQHSGFDKRPEGDWSYVSPEEKLAASYTNAKPTNNDKKKGNIFNRFFKK